MGGGVSRYRCIGGLPGVLISFDKIRAEQRAFVVVAVACQFAYFRLFVVPVKLYVVVFGWNSQLHDSRVADEETEVGAWVPRRQ